MVEDIIDTGSTMVKLTRYIADHAKPASIKVASLLEKRTGLNTNGKTFAPLTDLVNFYHQKGVVAFKGIM